MKLTLFVIIVVGGWMACGAEEDDTGRGSHSSYRNPSKPQPPTPPTSQPTYPTPQTPPTPQSRECFQPIQNLATGVVLHKQVAGGELCASYRDGNRVVYIQTLRGTRHVIDADLVGPNAPLFAISARIVDQGGQPIAVAMADEDTAMSKWLERVSGLDMTYHSVDPNQDLVLAQKAVNALAQVVPPGFEKEMEILQRRIFTASLSQSQIAQEFGDTAVMNVVDPQIQSNPQQSAWKYRVRVMKKGLLIKEGSLLQHSAVWFDLVRPEDGSRVSVVTCNHGTCADSMILHCQAAVAAASQRPFQSLPCDPLSPYGFFVGQHVCNDDTAMQYAMLARNNADFATCTDSSLRRMAPDCY